MSTFVDNLEAAFPRLKRIALKWCNYNEADADDLVQDTYERMLKKADQFDGKNFNGWAVRIMKNIWIDKWRAKKGITNVDLEDEILITALNDISLDVDDVRSALERLGIKCQEILQLIADEYKYSEIAQDLEIPIGTVENRVYRCRKQLKQELFG